MTGNQTSVNRKSHKSDILNYIHLEPSKTTEGSYCSKCSTPCSTSCIQHSSPQGAPWFPRKQSVLHPDHKSCRSTGEENNWHPAGGATVVTVFSGEFWWEMSGFFGRNPGATQSAPVTVIDVCTSSGSLGSARQKLYSLREQLNFVETFGKVDILKWIQLDPVCRENLLHPKKATFAGGFKCKCSLFSAKQSCLENSAKTEQQLLWTANWTISSEIPSGQKSISV